MNPSEDHLPTTQTSDDSSSSNARPLTVGILAAPDAATEIANALEPELPDLFTRYVDDQVAWRVHVLVDPLAGLAEEAASILEEAEHVKDRQAWDYALCLTDLPLFREQDFLVAEANGARGIAQLALPALGFVPMTARIREGLHQLLNEMHNGSSEADRHQEAERLAQREQQQDEPKRLVGARELFSKRWFERLAPVYRVQPRESAQPSDVRFVARPNLNGYTRMVTGMTRANHPWNVFKGFKKVIAFAFASGAYALIFPTLWQLSDAYAWPRTLALMVIALLTLTGWMILAHGLWERRSPHRNRYLTRMYNGATVLTMGFGVVGYYVVLLGLFFLAVFLFIPTSMLESSTGVGRTVGLPYFLSLAWLTTSLATCVGAIGGGLENEETVLKATYGYRQLQRREQAKQEEEEYEGRSDQNDS